ncbi:hypothetical protein [Myxosarcina sp. GI1]|nr:hypothetical protein [Myxosarcina sp. GI1]
MRGLQRKYRKYRRLDVPIERRKINFNGFLSLATVHIVSAR